MPQIHGTNYAKKISIVSDILDYRAVIFTQMLASLASPTFYCGSMVPRIYSCCLLFMERLFQFHMHALADTFY